MVQNPSAEGSARPNSAVRTPPHSETGIEVVTLEQLAFVAEIVGTIAVIASLLYLSVQVKDGTRASRSAAITDATAAVQALYAELGTNSKASQLFFNGLLDPESLSREAQFQFLMLLHGFFLGFQRNFFLAQEGTLNEELRDSIGTAIIAVNHLPGIDFYWRQRKSFFQPEFVAWTEELLRRESISDMEVYKLRETANERVGT